MIQWLLDVVIASFLNWLYGTLQRVAEGYKDQKNNEKINEKIKKGVVNAETPAERQAALDKAGRRLGRLP